MDLCPAKSRGIRKPFSYCHLRDITSQAGVQKARNSFLLKHIWLLHGKMGLLQLQCIKLCWVCYPVQCNNSTHTLYVGHPSSPSSCHSSSWLSPPWQAEPGSLLSPFGQVVLQSHSLEKTRPFSQGELTSSGLPRLWGKLDTVTTTGISWKMVSFQTI